MSSLEPLEILFTITAFLFQIILIIHFALRRWHFDLAIRIGPLVYALGVHAASVSVLLLLGNQPWAFWLGGFIYLAWGLYGYIVEYVEKLDWRNPFLWPVGGPYLCLYLATTMLNW